MSTPTLTEALSDALMACEALVYALGPALTPSQARSLRRIHAGLAGLILDRPAEPGMTQSLVELARTLDLTGENPVLSQIYASGPECVQGFVQGSAGLRAREENE
jgi:hypothetical protein